MLVFCLVDGHKGGGVYHNASTRPLLWLRHLHGLTSKDVKPEMVNPLCLVLCFLVKTVVKDTSFVLQTPGSVALFQVKIDIGQFLLYFPATLLWTGVSRLPWIFIGLGFGQSCLVLSLRR